MLKYMEEHPEVGACQLKILSYRQPDTFEYAGAAGGYIDRNGYPYCRGRIFANLRERPRAVYDNEAYIFWASGAALMVIPPSTCVLADSTAFLRPYGGDRPVLPRLQPAAAYAADSARSSTWAARRWRKGNPQDLP